MEKNYYPLRVSPGTRHIISDIQPDGTNDEISKREKKDFGGNWIAGATTITIAHQLVDAYNEKYAPKPKVTVGVHDGSNSEDYMDIFSPPGTKVTVSERSIKNGDNIDKAQAHNLKVGHVYTVRKTDVGPWKTLVILEELPGAFNSVQFVKPKDIIHIPYIKIKHLKHMESCYIDGYGIRRIHDNFNMIDSEGYEYVSGGTDGTSVTVAFIAVKTERIDPSEPPSVEAQMKHAELNGELPDYIVHKTTIDFEKVIEDLLTIVKEYSPHRGPTEYMYRSEIQNAEAALGMLQAFKKERGVKVPHVPKESTQFQHKPPGWVEKHSHVTTKSISEIHANERQMLVDEISKMLPVDPAKTVGSIPGHIHTANAIVFAIERYEQLKHKNR